MELDEFRAVKDKMDTIFMTNSIAIKWSITINEDGHVSYANAEVEYKR